MAQDGPGLKNRAYNTTNSGSHEKITAMDHSRNHFITHDGSMARTVYLPIHKWLFFYGFQVGKYTVRHMDPIPFMKQILHQL